MTFHFNLYNSSNMDNSSRENIPSDGAIRRSGRSRIVNSKYATSIDQLKKESTKRPPRKDRYSEEDSMFQSNQKEDSCSMDLQDSNWLECKLPEGQSHRMIWVTVVPPKKQPESRFRIPSMEIASSQCLRKKSSAFKKPTKEVVETNKPSLLGVLLAAMNRVVGQPLKEKDKEQQSASQYEDKIDNVSEKQEDISSLDAPKKQEGKQRSKLAERNEEFKRYVKMEAKFNTLSARFQELKNKMSIQI